MSCYSADNYDALRSLTDNQSVLQRINAVEEKHRQGSITYKKRLETKKLLTKLRQDAPPRILSMMNDVAVALDSGDVQTVEELFFHREGNLMDLLGDMLVMCNETEVVPAKKGIDKTGQRVDRATVLAMARDPSNSAWDFCPKCSRPMRTNWISYHQQNTMVCKEIKGGRSATLKTGVTKDTGEHIEHIALSLAGAVDSDEEDIKECLIDNYKNFGILFETPDGDEEDCGFFNTFQEAQAEFNKVVKRQDLPRGTMVVVFDSQNYNPETDNIGTIGMTLLEAKIN